MRRRTLYAFIASFILLIAVIILNRFSFRAMRKFSEEVDHTRLVITTFQGISNNFKSAQIYSPTHDTASLRKYYRLFQLNAERVDTELNDLHYLVRDNPHQRQIVSELDASIHRQLPALMQKNIQELIETGESWRLDSLFAIHLKIEKGIDIENNLLKERKALLLRYTHQYNLLSTALAVIGVGIIIVIFISNFFLVRRRVWLEGFLESILDTSRNGVVHYVAVREMGKIVDFRLAFINKAVDHLLGMKGAEVNGKRLSEISSYVMESGLFERYVQVVETGQPLEFETHYQRGSNSRWLLVSLVKLDDGLIASFHDIGQLKKYEGQLKENITSLERSNAELEQYAYVASHDLQEPLRKIRSFGSYLNDTQAQRLDDKGRMQLSKMLQAAERMSVLIRDILAYSGLKKADAYVSTDLNEILAAVMLDLELLISQKKAVIQADNLPTIQAIPLQMTQLFFNLLNNSLKFMKPDGDPTITISCRKLKKEEMLPAYLRDVDYYELVFQDNGIGFSQEYAEQIFGLFKRLNDRQLYPGSGIGLALCKKVVDNHHGSIRATGVENGGATFIIHIPARQY